MNALVIGFAGLSLVALIGIVYVGLRQRLISRRSQSLQARVNAGIATIDESPLAGDIDEIAMAEPFSDRFLLPVMSRAGSIFARLTPQNNIEQLRSLLDLTQNRTWTPQSVVTLQVLLLLLFAGGSAALGIAEQVDTWQIALLAAVGAAAGFVLPTTYLRRRLKSHKRHLERSMPDLLDLLTVTVEAGLSLSSALERTTRDVESPLNREIRKALRQAELGVPLVEALRDVADRIELRPLQSVVRVMSQSDRLGTSLGDVMRIHSETLRNQQRTAARAVGQKASVKMLFPMVGCIFPTIFAVLLGPAAINLIFAPH